MYKPVSPDAEVVVRQICTALAASVDARNAKVIPSVLITLPPELKSLKSTKKRTSADLAISWYRLHQFAADRARMNLYGYPGPLRELIYDQADDLDDADDLALEYFPSEIAETVKQLRAESAYERESLAEALGPKDLNELTKAIFEFDEFPPFVPGVPDLLVWLNTPGLSCWFLSEVKAPGDSLRSSQTEWLASNWHFVRGHYLLTILV